jgi:hypothetical protein
MKMGRHLALAAALTALQSGAAATHTLLPTKRPRPRALAFTSQQQHKMRLGG